MGRENRFSFFATYKPRPGDGVPLYDGLHKFDHATDSTVALIKFPPHLSAGEWSFVPRPAPRAEDDGFFDDME